MLEADLEIELEILLVFPLDVVSFLLVERSVPLRCFESSALASAATSAHRGQFPHTFPSFFELITDSSISFELPAMSAGWGFGVRVVLEKGD